MILWRERKFLRGFPPGGALETPSLSQGTVSVHFRPAGESIGESPAAAAGPNVARPASRASAREGAVRMRQGAARSARREGGRGAARMRQPPCCPAGPLGAAVRVRQVCSLRLPRRHRRQPRGVGALRPVPPCPAFAAALRGRWAVSHGQPRSGPPAKRAGAGTAPRPARPRLPGASSRSLRRSGRRPRAAASPWQRPEGAFRGGLEAGNDGAAGAEAAEPGRSHVSGWRRAARRWGRWRVRLARGRGGSSGTPGEGPRCGGSEARQVLELPRGSGLGGGRD